ncbi:MAG: hypothetical protein VZR11_10115 [Succinimonas sp.]|jgi:TPR repeat protein|nr:hypothetical protein [Succinimonas sp.]
MRPQNNRGFTLVELGIVVTVFIVLATTLYMCTGNSDSDVSENNAPQDCQIGNECLTKGSWYGNKGDLSRAGMFYGRACEFKKGAGCNKLGLLVEEGAGGYQQSFQEAAQYFEKACNYGEANGCSNLGSLYEDGRGGVQDNSRAKELYDKACQLKSAIGCYSLAHMYEKAAGARRDLVKAKENYGLSCDYGFQMGCDAHKKLNK